MGVFLYGAYNQSTGKLCERLVARDEQASGVGKQARTPECPGLGPV